MWPRNKSTLMIPFPQRLKHWRHCMKCLFAPVLPRIGMSARTSVEFVRLVVHLVSSMNCHCRYGSLQTVTHYACLFKQSKTRNQ